MTRLRGLVFWAALIGWALPASAHRLDEYLQAIRLDLAPDRVDLEIDLTAGVKVADAVVALIDTDHDGLVSTAEGEAYAQRVLQAIVLQIDGQRHDLVLASVLYPSVDEIKSGAGVIQFTASVEFSPLVPGPHRLYLQNRHQEGISVYLLNAYAPRSPAIEIKHQTRDVRQTEIRIEYTFTPTSVVAP